MKKYYLDEQSIIKSTEESKPDSMKLFSKQKNSTDIDSTNSFLTSICAGRGRLLKQKLNERKQSTEIIILIFLKEIFNKNTKIDFGIGSRTHVIQPVAQKRKEPNEFSDDILEDPIMSCDPESTLKMDGEMKEISSKLKKVVCVDDSVSRYHSNLCADTPELLTNLMAIKIDTGINKSIKTCKNLITQKLFCPISDHLRKYSNSLIRTIGNNSTPDLKVKLVTNYSGCRFPIGVDITHFLNHS